MFWACECVSSISTLPAPGISRGQAKAFVFVIPNQRLFGLRVGGISNLHKFRGRNHKRSLPPEREREMGKLFPKAAATQMNKSGLNLQNSPKWWKTLKEWRHISYHGGILSLSLCWGSELTPPSQRSARCKGQFFMHLCRGFGTLLLRACRRHPMPEMLLHRGEI